MIEEFEENIIKLEELVDLLTSIMQENEVVSDSTNFDKSCSEIDKNEIDEFVEYQENGFAEFTEIIGEISSLVSSCDELLDTIYHYGFEECYDEQNVILEDIKNKISELDIEL